VWATCAQPAAGFFIEPTYLIDILYQDKISMITMKLCTKCVLCLIVVTPFYYWSKTMVKILKGAEVHGWINTVPMQNGNFKHISSEGRECEWGEDIGQPELSHVIGEKVKWSNHFGKVASFFKGYTPTMGWFAAHLQGFSQEKWCHISMSCMWIFIIAPNWK
jgi:hypothetical protein